VRDAWTDELLQTYDSLNIQSVVLTENGENYDLATHFGQAAKFAADNHQAFASDVLVDTLLGINLTPGSLDWTPKTPSPADTGAAATVPAARVTGFFGGTWANTSYLGAADPAGMKWWQGWTIYAVN